MTIFRNEFDLCGWRLVRLNRKDGTGVLDGTGVFVEVPDNPFATHSILPIEYTFDLRDMQVWRL